MKKIISLIASIAMLATMVTSVSAAAIANNNPVVDTSFVELTAAEFENDWVGEALPDGQKAYLVDVNVSGLDLEVAPAGTTNVLKKKRTGVVLMYAGYELRFDSTDNIAAVYSMDGIGTPSSAEKTAKALFTPGGAPTGYPTIADGAAKQAATEAFVYQFVITVTGEVTGTPVAEFKVTQFDKDVSVDSQNYGADKDKKPSYTVNGEAATTVTFGAEQGGEEPAETEVVVSEKIDLESNGVIGAAWDVTIKNFDSAKDYMAKFVDAESGEERIGGEKAIDVSEFAETEGDLGFAVIMRLTTARNVALSIAIK